MKEPRFIIQEKDDWSECWHNVRGTDKTSQKDAETLMNEIETEGRFMHSGVFRIERTR